MARKRRQFTTFNLSFLDIMSCGFGATVLVFLIIDHSVKTETKDLNRDLMSEVSMLEEDVRDGEAGLVKLRTPCQRWTWKWWRPRAGQPASPKKSTTMKR